jgi:hypothetical protein
MRIVAEAIPARVAYYVALRVLHEAADIEYADTPHSKIRALDAVRVWRSRRLETRAERRARRAAAANPGLFEPSCSAVGVGVDPTARPASAPVFDRDSVYEPAGVIRPRDLAPGEMLQPADLPTAAQVLADQERETARGLASMIQAPNGFPANP